MDKSKFWTAFENAFYEFDFESAQRIMDIFDWIDYNTNGKTPSIENLKATVRDIFNSVYRSIGGSYWEHHGMTSSSNGGFTVTAYRSGRISIVFEALVSTGTTGEDNDGLPD
jgi:hypothetical protein